MCACARLCARARVCVHVLVKQVVYAGHQVRRHRVRRVDVFVRDIAQLWHVPSYEHPFRVLACVVAIESDRQAASQAGKQAGRQTDRQTGR